MFNSFTKFKRKGMMAMLPLAFVLGACGDTHTQLLAGDGIDPPTNAEMQTMAYDVYVFNQQHEPRKLHVNSLQVSDAMAFLPGDKSDFVVCIEWEAEEFSTVYSMDPYSGARTGIIRRPGDKYTAYGAYVARLIDNMHWSPVLFKRAGAKIGSTPITTICR
ncbi:hypothetical protein A9Q96_10055 [Rhodobacterales bacterium 52_120_T64]|nr:hypothetical protein A9Q96_10055 [Rhodobacterales bacterium 52_120_T64]